MLTPIWVVVNAGGRFRGRNLPDRIDAIVSKGLTEARFNNNADILAPGPYKQARKLKRGDRLAHLQGGSCLWRPIYGSGEFMAAGVVAKEATDLTNHHISVYPNLYRLTVEYYPQNRPGNRLVGIIFYSLTRAKGRLPRAQVFVRPMPGQKYILVCPGHRGFERLDSWWNATLK
jgi:hypothetical protein